MKRFVWFAMAVTLMVPGLSQAKKITAATCGLGFSCRIEVPIPDAETSNRIVAALANWNSANPGNPAVPGDIVTICNGSSCADYEIYSDGSFAGSNRRAQIGGGGGGSGGPDSGGGGSGGGGGTPNPGGGGNCAPKCGTVIVGPPKKGD